jgi:hypothetical protein
MTDCYYELIDAADGRIDRESAVSNAFPETRRR